MHADVSVTVQLKHDTTWKDIKDAAEILGVPDDAEFRLHEVPYASPVDPGYKEIIWKWQP